MLLKLFTFLALSFAGISVVFSQETSEFDTNIFGYLESYAEKVTKSPSGVDSSGNTLYETNPYEFDIPDTHFNVQSKYQDRYTGWFSVHSHSGERLKISTTWINAVLVPNYLNIKTGKLYRKFGLYNEQLDAVPTYIGIEPPELFDKDHLMLTRTTNLMLWGNYHLSQDIFSYALTTGNDERASGSVPFGLDVRYNFNSTLIFGSSFYSTGGKAVPKTELGQGSPDGGIVPWMSHDKYFVYGLFCELNFKNFLIQAEFWQAAHNGRRDPKKVVEMAKNVPLNKRQKERFGINNSAPIEKDITLTTKYNVTTTYLRSGYSFFTHFGEILPYLQFDYYKNPETVKDKDYGGDNEAGLSDDGMFYKLTAGSVFRPVPYIALKVDGSTHIQTFNQKREQYPEVRVSFSFFWNL